MNEAQKAQWLLSTEIVGGSFCSRLTYQARLTDGEECDWLFQGACPPQHQPLIAPLVAYFNAAGTFASNISPHEADSFCSLAWLHLTVARLPPQLTGFVTPSTSQAWNQKAPPIQLSEPFAVALSSIGTRTHEALKARP